MVARNVDGVHPIHRIGVGTERPPARQPLVESGEIDEQPARGFGVTAGGLGEVAEERGVVDMASFEQRQEVDGQLIASRRHPELARPSFARMPVDQAAVYWRWKPPSDSVASAIASSASSARSGSRVSANRARFHSATAGWLP